MCTVSWSLARESYDLFFNRDELDTRAPEQPPRVLQQEGVSFIAPRDGDHNGTWLLVNELGLTVCLLNDYANPWRPAASVSRLSRGQFVLACAPATDFESLLALMQYQPLERTLPFHLLAVSPGEGTFLLHWDGAALARHNEATLAPPLSSSSYATADVIATRTNRFNSHVRSLAEPQPAELFAYHREHRTDAGAHSVLMCRGDAATRSISHVSVNWYQVRFNYRTVLPTAYGPAVSEPAHVLLPRRCAAITPEPRDSK